MGECTLLAIIFISFILATVFFFVKWSYSKKVIKIPLIFTIILVILWCLSIGGYIIFGDLSILKDEKTVVMIIAMPVFDIFLLLTVIPFTCIGKLLCEKQQLPNFPILNSLLSRQESIKKSLQLIPWYSILFCFGIMIAGSLLLTKLTKPIIAPDMMDVFTFLESSIFGYIFGTGLFTPIVEEIIMRLFMLTALAYLFRNFDRRGLLAILLTSVIWALGHGGMIEPAWIKFVQVLIFGITLGFLMRRKGIEACIIVHSIINISVWLPIYD